MPSNVGKGKPEEEKKDYSQVSYSTLKNPRKVSKRN
jgi:hypothetical protein